MCLAKELNAEHAVFVDVAAVLLLEAGFRKHRQAVTRGEAEVNHAAEENGEDPRDRDQAGQRREVRQSIDSRRIGVSEETAASPP